MRRDELLLGAVAYDPKVVTIWDGFKAYVADHGLAFDYVLYTNYERQVDAHLAGCTWCEQFGGHMGQVVSRLRAEREVEALDPEMARRLAERLAKLE